MSEVAPSANKREAQLCLKELLRSIFDAAKAKGLDLTPDAAMQLLDHLATLTISVSESNGPNKNPGSSRANPAVFLRETHHCAVDLYYEFYFPRRKRTAGSSKKGASAIPDEHLDELLRLTRKRANLQEMADKFGYPGRKGRDRVRHQRDLGIKLYAEAVERVRRLGAAEAAVVAAKHKSADPNSLAAPVPAEPTTPRGKSKQRKK